MAKETSSGKNGPLWRRCLLLAEPSIMPRATNSGNRIDSLQVVKPGSYRYATDDIKISRVEHKDNCGSVRWASKLALLAPTTTYLNSTLYPNSILLRLRTQHSTIKHRCREIHLLEAAHPTLFQIHARPSRPQTSITFLSSALPAADASQTSASDLFPRILTLRAVSG